MIIGLISPLGSFLAVYCMWESSHFRTIYLKRLYFNNENTIKYFLKQIHHRRGASVNKMLWRLTKIQENKWSPAKTTSFLYLIDTSDQMTLKSDKIRALNQ